MSDTPSGWHRHANGGGFVQDTARVDESAQVSGNARVSGDALVYGDAQVYGDARVYGNAWVSGDARVSGDQWDSSPLYIQGSMHALTNSRCGHIAIGCHEHEFAYWKKHYKAIGRANGYTEKQMSEYKTYIDLFCKLGR